MEDGVYSTVAFSERVDRCPDGGYICLIACKVITTFLLGFPYKVVDMVSAVVCILRTSFAP